MQLFAYFAALVAYLGLAALGLVLCLAAAAFVSSRQQAKRIAGGILGSFPGVFAFQVVAIPIVAVALLGLLGFQAVTGELAGTAQVVVIGLSLLATVGVFAGASVLGFVVGWGVGYRVASGMPISASLRASRILSYPMCVASRNGSSSAV